MTRVNCIPPAELTDQHLIAEYREIPRLFKQARHGANVPASYRLGAGHVTFFYNKLAFISDRWDALVNEMVTRGFAPSAAYTTYVRDLRAQRRNDDPTLFGGWSPTPDAQAINRQRIAERLA